MLMTPSLMSDGMEDPGKNDAPSSSLYWSQFKYKYLSNNHRATFLTY